MNLYEINREMDKLLMKYRSNGVGIDKHTMQASSGASKGNDRCEKPSSTSDIEKSTYLCHICDIHIPKGHKNDHVNNTTHIELLKLANHATERLNKHVSQQIEQLPFNSKDNSNHSNNTNNNSYYCVQCNLLLEKEAEERHKSDEEHQKSVNKALFVATLFKCYTGLNTDDFMAKISRWSSGYGTKVTEDNSDDKYAVQDDIENNNDLEVTVNIAEKARDIDIDSEAKAVKTENDVTTKLFLQQIKLLLQTAAIKEENKSREEMEYQSSTNTGRREPTVTELVHALSAKQIRVEVEVGATKVKEEVAEILDGINPQQILSDFGKEQIEFTNNGSRQNSVPCNVMHLEHITPNPHKEAMKKDLPSQVKYDSKIPYDISLTTADVEMVDHDQLAKSQDKTNKEKVKKTIQKYQRRPKYQNGFVFCNLCSVRLVNEISLIIIHVNGRRHRYIASKASVFDIEHNAPDMLAYFYYREQNARRVNRRVEHDFCLFNT